ncbi:MAG TPA: ABC transporter ATP-binding protein [Chthoniobacteraceae bacterium]|jgi:peptide/nickel transport system ATP-binding protein/oligopeptide transport system ATP-binding protein|nr:ABC transporter ATP-binding protein [Chthoniobacteraceae bacterium]
MPLLEVRNLAIDFNTEGGVVNAVKGISFTLEKGKTLAVVGESGSGKSVTGLALTRLLPEPPAVYRSGEILLDGRDVLKMGQRELRSLRGAKIAYIFQEPSTSLNPVFTIRSQIAEAIKLHRPEVKKIDDEVVKYLDMVGIVSPRERMHDYPHQLSGGMQQRAMIAMALSCEPDILVADEPTTALDVTIQAQIIDQLRELKQRLDMAIILITHNFGIIGTVAEDVAVMFRGKIVEQGSTAQVLRAPQHPYTKALIECIPQLGQRRERLTTIDHAALDALA